MSGLPPVCILAGGLGSRLGECTRSTPKPLLEVAGEPFLSHQLRLLAEHGASELVLCVGHLGEQIQASLGCERFGLRIAYSFDAPGLEGTLGALRRARGLLGERFLVLYGDTYLRLDFAAAAAAWQASGLPAMMTVLHNQGRWGVSNVAYAHERVLAYDKRAPVPGMHWIDYGLSGLEQDALDLVPAQTRELSDLFHHLAGAELLYGFPVRERFYEIGTPAALAETRAFLRGREARSLLTVDGERFASKGDPVSAGVCGGVYHRLPVLERKAPRARGRTGSMKEGARGLLAPDSGLLAQGTRFILAGGLGTLVYMLVTTLMAAVVGLPFQAALIVGFCAALSVNFVSQRWFVWVKGERYSLSLRHQGRRYLLLAWALYGATVLGTLLLPPLLGVPTEIVYVVITALLSPVNFIIMRFGIFHASASACDSSAALAVKTA